MKNKLYLTRVLILIFAFLLMPINQEIAYADSIVKQDGYEFDKNTGEIIQYTGKSTNLVIPDEIDGVTVSRIKGMAFYMWQGKKLTIPSSILEIEDYAFCACGCLQEICVDKKNPNYSSKDGVLFDKEMSVLINYPEQKSDTSYTILDGVEKVENCAFEYNEYLTSITISDTLEMTSALFGSIPNLNQLKANKTNFYHTVIDGILFDKDMKTIIQYPRGKEGKKYIIPDGVITIADGAFSLVEDLEEIQIPNSVTEIKRNALSGCHLNLINIPQGVTVLEEEVLSYTRLNTISISNNITAIKEKVFFSCAGIDNITIPDNVKSIGAECFASCDNLQNISLPNTITTIEDGTFMYCDSLKDMVLPKNIVSIGDKAFLACRSLKEISIPDSVQSIGKESFAYCDKLEKIEIPESVTSIDATAFKNSRPTIYGKTGSYAESFAKKRNIKFVDESLEKTAPTTSPSPTTLPQQASTNTIKTSSSSIYAGIGIILLTIVGLTLLIMIKKGKKK